MTKQMQKMIDKELKKRIEELKPELATRYEELLNMRNMEIDQFNDGFNDARAGKLETDHPHYDLDTDNWRLGFAWGMFEPMKEKLARERQVSDALYLLLVDDPNTKLKAEQILIDIYGKCEPSLSDVSVTQDVLIDIKTPRSIENKLTDALVCNARLVEQVPQLAAERDEWKQDAERLAKFQYEHSFVEFEAKVWVSEWMKSIKNDRSIATSEGTMLCWFANAIMAGYDKARAELAEWREDAERFIQLANFNNKKAGEYFELHEQLVKKYEVTK